MAAAVGGRVNRCARYRYSLRTHRNEWIDYDHSQIFGWSQAEIAAMGDRVLERIIHCEDLQAVNFYHRRLKFLHPDDGHDQIFCRCYSKHGDNPLYVRFVDRCVESGPDGNCAVIEGEATVLGRSEFNARKRLEHGIRAREFGFLYQPICRLDTGAVAGYEALARWFRGGEVIGPAVFLPLIEGSSLEQAWIVSQVEVLVEALDRLPDGLWLSYNLSRGALEAGNALPVLPVARAQRLHVEVLESVSLQLSRALAHLKFIRSLGHPLYIDDYGMGYSLESLLSGLPLSGLKLDRILMDSLLSSTRTQRIVADILSLAQSEGLEVVAEWVQHPEQVEWLLAHGCAYGQGALFGLAGELPEEKPLGRG